MSKWFVFLFCRFFSLIFFFFSSTILSFRPLNPFFLPSFVVLYSLLTFLSLPHLLLPPPLIFSYRILLSFVFRILSLPSSSYIPFLAYFSLLLIPLSRTSSPSLVICVYLAVISSHFFFGLSFLSPLFLLLFPHVQFPLCCPFFFPLDSWFNFGPFISSANQRTTLHAALVFVANQYLCQVTCSICSGIY
ncbi:hypothetical protein GALMADRAFT_1139405 [Galerina marginata CBS 339.88]|uniref:Uncharacterized protein n=1 Tax=Galerina marginata (strain CBS 339.88) TaxID=685588 RepID=A0A067SG65_GALM3|nr:hypothetical protein GALMADRAFT_1139405 [Galerina marginata CBS 339.88]